MKRIVMYGVIAALLLSFAAAQTPDTNRLSAATLAATPKRVVHVAAPIVVPSMVGTMTPGSITAKITAWILPLRDGPSRRGKVLDRLKHGTVVTVIGVNRFHTWIEVQVNGVPPAAGQPATMQASAGETGWISVFYVQLRGGRLKSVPVTG